MDLYSRTSPRVVGLVEKGELRKAVRTGADSQSIRIATSPPLPPASPSPESPHEPSSSLSQFTQSSSHSARARSLLVALWRFLDGACELSELASKFIIFLVLAGPPLLITMLLGTLLEGDWFKGSAEKFALMAPLLLGWWLILFWRLPVVFFAQMIAKSVIDKAVSDTIEVTTTGRVEKPHNEELQQLRQMDDRKLVKVALLFIGAVICFPVGLVFTWLSSEYSRTTKAKLSVTFAVVLALIFLLGYVADRN